MRRASGLVRVGTKGRRCFSSSRGNNRVFSSYKAPLLTGIFLAGTTGLGVYTYNNYNKFGGVFCLEDIRVTKDWKRQGPHGADTTQIQHEIQDHKAENESKKGTAAAYTPTQKANRDKRAKEAEEKRRQVSEEAKSKGAESPNASRFSGVAKATPDAFYPDSKQSSREPRNEDQNQRRKSLERHANQGNEKMQEFRERRGESQDQKRKGQRQETDHERLYKDFDVSRSKQSERNNSRSSTNENQEKDEKESRRRASQGRSRDQNDALRKAHEDNTRSETKDVERRRRRQSRSDSDNSSSDNESDREQQDRQRERRQRREREERRRSSSSSSSDSDNEQQRGRRERRGSFSDDVREGARDLSQKAQNKYEQVKEDTKRFVREHSPRSSDSEASRGYHRNRDYSPRDSARDLKRSGEEKYEELKQKGQEKYDQARRSVRRVKRDAERSVEDLSDSASESYDDAKREARRLKRKGEKKVEGITETAKQTWDATARNINNVTTRSADFVQDKVDRARRASGEYYDQAGDYKDEVVGKAKELYGYYSGDEDTERSGRKQRRRAEKDLERRGKQERKRRRDSDDEDDESWYENEVVVGYKDKIVGTLWTGVGTLIGDDGMVKEGERQRRRGDKEVGGSSRRGRDESDDDDRRERRSSSRRSNDSDREERGNDRNERRQRNERNERSERREQREQRESRENDRNERKERSERREKNEKERSEKREQREKKQQKDDKARSSSSSSSSKQGSSSSSNQGSSSPSSSSKATSSQSSSTITPKKSDQVGKDARAPGIQSQSQGKQPAGITSGSEPSRDSASSGVTSGKGVQGRGEGAAKKSNADRKVTPHPPQNSGGNVGSTGTGAAPPGDSNKQSPKGGQKPEYNSSVTGGWGESTKKAGSKTNTIVPSAVIPNEETTSGPSN